MDAHQKISIGIFGALLLGTMAMYSTGSLSSSAINTSIVDTGNPCQEVYMKEYAKQYDADKQTLKELQQFVGRNCQGEVVESKQSYCDAKKKQSITYTKQIEKYEQCIEPTSAQ